MMQTMTRALRYLGDFWIDQLGGTFLVRGSTLSLAALTCTFLVTAFCAVPRGHRSMPRAAVWCRAIFPRRLWKSASGRADIAYFLFGLFFYGLAFGWAAMSSLTVATVTGDMLVASFGRAHPLALDPLLATMLLTGLFFTAYEFAYWFDHWLSHKSPLLWQFHRVHHAAESLSLLTNFRVHPIDTIVFAAITALVVGLTQGAAGHVLGSDAHAWTIGGANAIGLLSAICLTHLQHSHLWIKFGARGGRWLLGPAHHQIHHSADPRHHDCNFGSTIALWDRLFGTLHLPQQRREPLRFGLGAEEPAPHGWHAALVRPVTGAVAVLLPEAARPTAAEAPGPVPEPITVG